MAGLVLEGGSLRGIFSAGVMDALLDHHLHFDYVIGVSAGISNGVSYVSCQKERNLEIMRRFRNDKRYLSKRNFLKCRSIFGLNFIFDEIPNKLLPFDWVAYDHFPGTVKVGVTDALTGEAVYMDGKSLATSPFMLRATCAIPFFFPPITVDGKEYFDGGLSDAIPIKQSITDGNTKNLVILTQPRGYIKEASKMTTYGARYYKNKRPGLSETMLNRPQMYNETLAYIDTLEKQRPDDIVVLRPAYPLDSFESDISILEKNYQHGYSLATKDIRRITKLLAV